MDLKREEGDGQPYRGFILLNLEILGIPSTSMMVLRDLVR